MVVLKIGDYVKFENQLGTIINKKVIDGLPKPMEPYTLFEVKFNSGGTPKWINKIYLDKWLK